MWVLLLPAFAESCERLLPWADSPSALKMFVPGASNGTGKTTLSQDEGRVLIGDDEHGWSNRGIFNFEGGCYAKTLNLSAEAEPEIHSTMSKFSTVIENMNFHPDTLELDYQDDSLTPNMRSAYPLESISNVSKKLRVCSTNY